VPNPQVRPYFVYLSLFISTFFQSLQRIRHTTCIPNFRIPGRHFLIVLKTDIHLQTAYLAHQTHVVKEVHCVYLITNSPRIVVQSNPLPI